MWYHIAHCDIIHNDYDIICAFYMKCTCDVKVIWYQITLKWYHLNLYDIMIHEYDIKKTKMISYVCDIMCRFILYDMCRWYPIHIVWYHMSWPMISNIHVTIFTLYDIMSMISWMISYIILAYHVLSYDIRCSLHKVGHLRHARHTTVTAQAGHTTRSDPVKWPQEWG